VANVTKGGVMRASQVPARSGLFVFVVALGAALVLGVAPSAQAANIVPNPGFEGNCAGAVCQWQGIDGTNTYDTTSFLRGVASLRLTSTGGTNVISRRVRVNKRLLPALSLRRGGVSGGAYSFVDRRAPRHRALRYWVQDVDIRGHRTWHGPVRIGAS
jgi:hypothetical protein